MAPHPLHPRPVRILSPSVAERIAAGEVIERPASVVKELVENALDAGATQIEVALEDGGKSVIEVTDNGHGMDPESLALAVRRHATSKLSSLEDLERLTSLGFRGEALPSVAAVSELSILSKSSQGERGVFEIRMGAPGAPAEPFATTHGHFLGSPHGTKVRACGLFAQVPARLKFLKSQAAEVSQTREWIERLALAHPRAAFRLLSDGRTVLQLRAATEVERMLAVLGSDAHQPVASAEDSEGEALRIRVHWLQGLSLPHSRRIAQVVNGRAVRDKLLQQALLSPFRQALLPGQFPAVALLLEIDPALIDVNVHPTKAELRFLDSRGVFRRVESLIEELIRRYGAPALAISDTSIPAWVAAEPSPRGFSPSPGWGALSAQSAIVFPSRSESLAESSPAVSAVPATAPVARSADQFIDQLRLDRYVGPLFNTYLMYDLGQEIALIDQHAAHERIRYEGLRRRMHTGRASAGAQELLMPESVAFDPERRADIEARLPWLVALGFSAELFGEDQVLVRSVPAEWGSDDLTARLKNLLERLLLAEAAPSGSGLLMDEAVFERLASEACHSAVRAGDRLNATAGQSIVTQLFACDHPWNCPHGRPTVVRIPRGKLEEWFQRRI